jgi:hypothetical protein
MQVQQAALIPKTPPASTMELLPPSLSRRVAVELLGLLAVALAVMGLHARAAAAVVRTPLVLVALAALVLPPVAVAVVVVLAQPLVEQAGLAVTVK